MSRYQFNPQQITIVEQLALQESVAELELLFNQTIEDIEQQLLRLKVANALYRSGQPVISDQEYDDYVSQFSLLAPEHEYLNAVEPEVLAEAKTGGITTTYAIN